MSSCTIFVASALLDPNELDIERGCTRGPDFVGVTVGDALCIAKARNRFVSGDIDPSGEPYSNVASVGVRTAFGEFSSCWARGLLIAVRIFRIPLTFFFTSPGTVSLTGLLFMVDVTSLKTEIDFGGICGASGECGPGEVKPAT